MAKINKTMHQIFRTLIPPPPPPSDSGYSDEIKQRLKDIVSSTYGDDLDLNFFSSAYTPKVHDGYYRKKIPLISPAKIYLDLANDSEGEVSVAHHEGMHHLSASGKLGLFEAPSREQLDSLMTNHSKRYVNNTIWPFKYEEALASAYQDWHRKKKYAEAGYRQFPRTLPPTPVHSLFDSISKGEYKDRKAYSDPLYSLIGSIVKQVVK